MSTFIRRYQDKSSAKHNLDEFLKNAYAKQIRELNGTTGKACWDQLEFVSLPNKLPISPLDPLNGNWVVNPVC